MKSNAQPFPVTASTLLRAFVAILSLNLGWGFNAYADWPQFLGPNRNAAAIETNELFKWPEAGPKILWKRPVGEGFAGPAIVGETVVLFHRRDGKELVELLDIQTGKSRWTNSAPTSYRDDFGFDEGPRAVPTIQDGKVFALGADGALRSVELSSGKTVWERRLRDELKAGKGFFGVAGSPLVVSNLVILNIGGGDGHGIIALDAGSGKLRWSATDDEASYASPAIASVQGRPLLLCFTRAGLVGLDVLTGKVRFEAPWRSKSHASVNAATPVVFDEKVFITSSYDTGAMLLDLTSTPPREIWSNDISLSSHYATPVYSEGHLYGFHGRQETGGEFRCIDAATGKVAWSEPGMSMGQVIRVGQKLLVLTEQGELLLVAINSKRCEILARSQVLGSGTRAAPAFSKGLLVARDQRQLVCLELAKP